MKQFYSVAVEGTKILGSCRSADSLVKNHAHKKYVQIQGEYIQFWSWMSRIRCRNRWFSLLP